MDVSTSYERLAWDSEFFGIPIGRVIEPLVHGRIARAAAAADADGIACLYLLLSLDSQDALGDALGLGFIPYDVRMELDKRLERVPRVESNGIRAADPDDIPTLERIARGTFTGTRFFADPQFPAGLVPEMYAIWARRGVETYPLRRTFLTEDSEGFVVCRVDEETEEGTIELIGFIKEATGRRLGATLVHHADATFAHLGLRRGVVVTQGANVAAQRLYQSSGYRSRRLGVWLHRWHPERCLSPDRSRPRMGSGPSAR
jgi:ribosomal protein S18 acetylase RimI-like enzyme